MKSCQSRETGFREIKKWNGFFFISGQRRRRMADLPLKAGLLVQPKSEAEKPYLLGA
jgi:hypothetical protein